MNLKKYSSVSLILVLLGGVQAMAAQQSASNPLQVSGGIAAPATATSVLTNPAGMVAASTAVVLQAAAPEVWDNGTYRGGLQTGGSSFGVAAGVESTGASNNVLNAYYGLAVGSESFTLGVAGKTGISNSSGSTFNAGLLFGVAANAKIGLTARGIDNGVNEWGAGVAFGVASNVDLVLDAAASKGIKNIEVKPGLKVSSSEAALTVSYGTGAKEQFADGFSAGGSYSFSAGSSLEVEYNAGGALSKYFVALAFGF